ncbi:MAG TPA: primosomal protein N' [Candidatus Saccharimonadales bacterium]|nr:primosomal protein N' [Candidatus Saccharimonadales bacterium]
MYYFEVIPANKKFHGKEPLTYCYRRKLAPGQIVTLHLRGVEGTGVIIKEIKKPDFAVLDIDDPIEKIKLPPAHMQLMKWMLDFYPGSVGAVAQLFVPGFLKKDRIIMPSSSEPRKLQKVKIPPLTAEQSSAYNKLQAKDTSGKTYILKGVTGSGKTRVYVELAKDNLKKNKSAIILTPEISLTAPIADYFKKTFGDYVRINHSALTQKQRRELWSEAFAGNRPMIVIGPRSSLFLPLRDIGLIISDEFHEPAYKQDARPFYHANRVASMLAKSSDAKLIFGSATPTVTDYYLARQKKAPLVTMDRLAVTGKQPTVNSTVVNLLDHQERTGYALISKTLISKISAALKENEQALLFINKRGSARSVACQDCGNRELCINCDLPLVYHGDQHIVRCHTCGFSKKPPVKCSVCGSMNIYFNSPGTKAIFENLSKIFPKARIARFDKDNKKFERMENIYDEVVEDVDIIIGTQIVAKGHDLPRLSVVAMLLADNELNFPDFSAAERGYQLIKQLGGRISRGHRAGTFVVQTFNTSSKFLQSALNGNWDDFYAEEIRQRNKHGFPPFYSMLKVESSRKSRKAAEKSLINLIDKLGLAQRDKLELSGPYPSFVEKKSAKWHWQLVAKSKNRSILAEIAGQIPSSFKADLDPMNLL